MKLIFLLKININCCDALLRCLGPRILTWADTFEDLCPCRGSMTRMQPMQFRIPNQSSMPSYACLGGRLNSVVFCRQSNRPIGRQQSTQRKRCDRWTPVFFGLGRSANNAITTTKVNGFDRFMCSKYVSIMLWDMQWALMLRLPINLPIPGRMNRTNR